MKRGNMGLKNWLAKNVAGVEAYGGVMGRESVKNGLAIGRTLYLGHGSCAGKSRRCVFESAESMISEGYTVYCADTNRMPPNEDSSQLSVLTRAAGVAFAARITDNAAGLCFSKPENHSIFCRSLTASAVPCLKDNSPDLPVELLQQFLNLKVPPTVTVASNPEKPGTDDLFGVILEEISNQHGLASVGFQRRGILGFDQWVVSLVEETTSAIQKAANEFGW
jgi:hypothetical protein